MLHLEFWSLFEFKECVVEYTKCVVEYPNCRLQSVQVMAVIINEALPLLYANAMAGHVEFSTTNCVFERHSNASGMFVDVLTDRGFKVSHKRKIVGGDAVRVDPKTGTVHQSPSTPQHSFRISFQGGNVRESNMHMGHVPLTEMRCGRRLIIEDPFLLGTIGSTVADIYPIRAGTYTSFTMQYGWVFIDSDACAGRRMKHC